MPGEDVFRQIKRELEAQRKIMRQILKTCLKKRGKNYERR